MGAANRHRVLVLAAVVASIAGGPVARADVLGGFHVGVEGGASLPVNPSDFAGIWDAGRGFGVVVSRDVTPGFDLLLRVEHERYSFAGDPYTDVYWSGYAVTGETARVTATTVGVRVHQSRGSVRGFAAFYAGVFRRAGRHARVTYASGTYDLGEADGQFTGVGFGVGLTWQRPGWPGVTAESRTLMFGTNEMTAPFRVGIVVP